MIDTIDGAYKKKEGEQEEQEEANVPVVSNEAKSEIQRALNMTDELNNHCTYVFEQNNEESNEN